MIFECIGNGLNNLAVPGAATQHTTQRLNDLRIGRVGILVEQHAGRHEHAGRAESALRCSMT